MQFDFGVIPPSTTSGTDLAGIFDNFRDALLTNHSGGSRPSYAKPGQFWINNAGSKWALNLFDGTDDVTIGFIDPNTHIITLNSRTIDAETTIAAATSIDIGAATSSAVKITGTATIGTFGVVPNQVRYVRFSGTPTLAPSPTLVLPGNANIVTQEGDTCIAISDNTGVFRIVGYLRADGRALIAATPLTAADIRLMSTPTGRTLTANTNLAQTDTNTLLKLDAASRISVYLPDNSTSGKNYLFYIFNISNVAHTISAPNSNAIYGANPGAPVSAFDLKALQGAIILAVDGKWMCFKTGASGGSLEVLPPITTSMTWTVPADMNPTDMVEVMMWGGGGGGSQFGTNFAGGGGGACERARFFVGQLGTSVSITIGAGGGVTGAGGITQFGSKLWAYGGGAGVSSTPGAGAQSATMGAMGNGGNGGGAGTKGGDALYGGGGGGGQASGYVAPGLSTYGGQGGTGGNSATGTNGVAPGGAGGGGGNLVGARGECRITLIRF